MEFWTDSAQIACWDRSAGGMVFLTCYFAEALEESVESISKNNKKLLVSGFCLDDPIDRR
jgi:hypothetical protein